MLLLVNQLLAQVWRPSQVQRSASKIAFRDFWLKHMLYAYGLDVETVLLASAARTRGHVACYWPGVGGLLILGPVVRRLGALMLGVRVSAVVALVP